MNRTYLPLAKNSDLDRSAVKGHLYKEWHRALRYLAPLFAIQFISVCIGPDLSGQSSSKTTLPHDAEYYAFRNAATTPPPHPDTPVFHLSHDYPHSLPHPLSVKCSENECPWLYIKDLNFSPNFPKNGTEVESPKWHGQYWDIYMRDILNYVKEGQTTDLNDSDGWRVEVDHHTRWSNRRGWLTIQHQVVSMFTARQTSEQHNSLNLLARSTRRKVLKRCSAKAATVKRNIRGVSKAGR